MRADTHDGPEQDAPHQRPDTLMQLSRSSLLDLHLATRGRAIHYGTFCDITRRPSHVRFRGEAVVSQTSAEVRVCPQAAVGGLLFCVAILLIRSPRPCERAASAALRGRALLPFAG